MRTKKLILSITSLLAAMNGAHAKDVLRCERKPDKYNEFTRTQLVVSSPEAGPYTYYASRCKGYHGSFCLTELGDYESFGSIEADGGNYKNQDIAIVRICAGIRIFHDQKEKIYLDFEPRECEVSF